MPAKRLSMRKIKEVLRLKWVNGLSNRQIARISGVARPTVAEYLRRAAEAGISWPAELDEVFSRMMAKPRSTRAGNMPLRKWNKPGRLALSL